jgi:hypothetical protein
VAGAPSPRGVLRRPDLGRRRLRGIGRLGAAGRDQRCRAVPRATAHGAAQDDGHGGAGLLRLARGRQALSAEQHHVRDRGAARAGGSPAAPRPQGAQRGDLRAGPPGTGRLEGWAIRVGGRRKTEGGGGRTGCLRQ